MISRVILGLLQLISERAYAQNIPLPPEPPTLEKLVTAVLFIVNKIGPAIGLFGFAMIIYGGYLWIASGGEPQKKQKAQATLTWSIIGVGFFYLIRMFLAWVLDWFVQ